MHSIRHIHTAMATHKQLFIYITYCAGRNNYNAETMETAPKDYSIVGTSADKAFNALGSLGTMAFAYNTVILPEIQVSTAQHSTAQRV